MAMVIPIIVIEDWNEDAPLASKYIRGEHEIDLDAIYVKIKRLPYHEGRGYLEHVPDPSGQSAFPGPTGQAISLKACDQAFIDEFWQCTANLLDYFADFLVHDSLTMQSVWFHLLDVLKEAGKLPHDFWRRQLPSCSHARSFATDYEQVLMLFNAVITPCLTPHSKLLVVPHRMLTQASNIHWGAVKTGLKPWQQYLYSGSPGFDVPIKDRVYPHGAHDAVDGASMERCVPRGALAIIQKHTTRGRELALKAALKNSTDLSEAEVHSAYDQHAFKFGAPSTYTSLEQRYTYVQQMYPNPTARHAPLRYEGLADPSLLAEKPRLTMLDEGAGSYTGSKAFRHPEGDEKFGMLVVRSASLDVAVESRDRVERKRYLEMYDDGWTRKDVA